MFIIALIAAGIFLVARSRNQVPVGHAIDSTPANLPVRIVTVQNSPVAVAQVGAPQPILQNQMPYIPVPFIPNKMVTNVDNGTTRLEGPHERGTFFRGRMLT